MNFGDMEIQEQNEPSLKMKRIIKRKKRKSESQVKVHQSFKAAIRNYKPTLFGADRKSLPSDMVVSRVSIDGKLRRSSMMEHSNMKLDTNSQSHVISRVTSQSNIGFKEAPEPTFSRNLLREISQESLGYGTPSRRYSSLDENTQDMRESQKQW